MQASRMKGASFLIKNLKLWRGMIKNCFKNLWAKNGRKKLIVCLIHWLNIKSLSFPFHSKYYHIQINDDRWQALLMCWMKAFINKWLIIILWCDTLVCVGIRETIIFFFFKCQHKCLTLNIFNWILMSILVINYGFTYFEWDEFFFSIKVFIRRLC